jgi:hypothetical protein
VATVQGANQITFDATAIAAINAASTLYSLVTQRQFRIGIGGIYNLISLDPNFAANGIATLDRIYLEPTVSGSPYNIYQAYYPSPVQDLRRLVSVRNLINPMDLGLLMTREELDLRDPQRTWQGWPTEVVPWGLDNRSGSATFQYMLFELWGAAITPYSFQIYGIRNGTDLVNPTDTLPPPVAEDLVLALAKKYVYEWAEANKDIQPRSSGPDFKFLLEQTMSEYKRLLIRARREDKELMDNYFSVRPPYVRERFGYYDTRTGYSTTYAGASYPQ